MLSMYLLKPLMKCENSENRYLEFSLLWKTFLLNLCSCLINSFIINNVCKNLKENVNIKQKANMKWSFVFYIKKLKDRLEEFFSIFFRYTEMNEKILILMQLEDFNRIKRRGGWKIVSVFPFVEKTTDIWEQPLVFRGAFLPGNLRCSGSTKSGHTSKIRCSVIAWDIDVFWIVIWRANSKYLQVIRYSGKDLHIFLG